MSLVMKKISTAAVRSVAMVAPVRRGYHDIIIDHYENPRNVGSLDKNKTNVGTGKSVAEMRPLSH